MNFRPLCVSGCFFASALLTLAGCAVAGTSVESTSDGELQVKQEALTASDETNAKLVNFPNNGYYVVTRRDFRRCASPMCGGFYVKRLNDSVTVCADGSRQAECYVAALKLTGLGLSEREESELRDAAFAGKAIVKGRISKAEKNGKNGTTYGTLNATEGWVGATGSTPDGTFYRVSDSGVRCVRAPCPTTTLAELNGTTEYNLLSVNLNNTASLSSEASLDRAARALSTPEGFLVVGSVGMPKCRPDSDCGPFVTASEFYLRVVRRDGGGCGYRSAAQCNEGQYCSWKAEDICGAADAGGTCLYKPSFCNDAFEPVCACDGETYPNACVAAMAGASVSGVGACAVSTEK